MPIRYQTKKDWKMALAAFSSPAIVWGMMLVLPHVALLIIALVLTVLFTWMWFDAGYLLDDEFLRYRFGPVRGKIPIEKIKEVTPGVRTFAGIRPGLTFVYLQIRYNVYDDIFISPVEESKLIEELKSKNPDIVVNEPGAGPGS